MERIKRSELAGLSNGSRPPTWPVSDPSQQIPVGPPNQRSTIRSLQVALVVVSLLAVCLAVAVVFLAIRGTVSTDPTAPATSVPVTEAPEPAPPPSQTGPEEPFFLTQYVAVNPEAVQPGAIIIEIHTDYQCPWCGRAEAIYGEAFSELSQAGKIDLRIHLRTMIGQYVVGNDSSQRASQAALCADDLGMFWPYHSVIFANQPHEGVGYTDDQLRVDFPAKAGIKGQQLKDFQACYDAGATIEAVSMMEAEGAQAGINGTPYFYVNGMRANFDLQANNSVPEVVEADDLLDFLLAIAG